MSFNYTVSFSVLLLFVTSFSLAQDTLSTSVDELYREDQFYVGVTYNLLSEVPDGVAIRGLSGGFQVGFLRDMPINKKRNMAIALGAGFAFDRFGQTLFIGETTNEKTVFTVLDGTIDYDSNRFSMATFEAPIELRWRTSTAETYKFWRVYAGFKVGYVYWFQSKFKQSGHSIYQGKVPEFDRLRLGTTLSFGYNTFNFYLYYSVNPFFKNAQTTNGQTVDFKTLKIGLQFYIL